MSIERSINVVINKITGEVINSNDIFSNKIEGFSFRDKFHNENMEFICFECSQDLDLSYSKKDLLYFKHIKGSEFCSLVSEKYIDNQLNEITIHQCRKESQRHINLKNEIGEKLKKTKGVKDVYIDDKFIFHNNSKRKPDVFCEYKGKKIVFEIQISKLPLKYILSRHKFYKSIGYYLIWVLDDFDLTGQTQTERDIKYLNTSQNFFRLDEDSIIFKLICNYKYSYLNKRNQLLSNWKTKFVNLNQLSFEEIEKQVYFFNYKYQHNQLEKKQLENQLYKIKKAEKEKILDRENKALFKAKDVKNRIKSARNIGLRNYMKIHLAIYDMDEYELHIFNEELNLNKAPVNPAIHQWVETIKSRDLQFIKFILESLEINFDVNQLDGNGNSLLSKLYLNSEFEHKELVLKSMLKRGYLLLESDEVYIRSYLNDNVLSDKLIVVSKQASDLINKSLVDKLFNNKNLFCVIESAINKKIVGFRYKPNEWIQFGNNAVQNYSSYWEYIEVAFKNFGVWSLIIDLDKKDTFKNKVNLVKIEKKKGKEDISEIFYDLYPEIFYKVNK